MKIEKELLQIAPYDLSPNPQGGLLRFTKNGRQFQVSSLQYAMLEALRNQSFTIEGLVQFYLGQGWLVSFRELTALIRFLLQEKALLNPAFEAYFQSAQTLPAQTGKALAPSRELPFLRSLDPQLADHFLKNSRILNIPAHTRILTQDENTRDLYIVLSGQLGIYRRQSPQHVERQALLQAGSLFGERGFLLGHPRSADIVATQDSQVLKISFLPEYDSLIRSDKAQSLQQRFWILQALCASEILAPLPSDSHDALIFSGRLVQAPAHTVLFKEGQSGNTCYVLVQGSIVASQGGKNINVFNQGAVLGEISLLASGGQRTATLTTQKNCLLLEIGQQQFYQVLSQNLLLAEKIETLAYQRLQKDRSR